MTGPFPRPRPWNSAPGRNRCRRHGAHRPGRPGSQPLRDPRRRAVARPRRLPTATATPSCSRTPRSTRTAGSSGVGSTLVRAALDDVRAPGRDGRGAVLVRARLDRAAPRVRRPPGALGVVTATRREPAAAVVPAPDDHVLGDPVAPVTVVEYGDYECPYCAAAAPVLRQLVEESDGQVRLVFRNFPLADRHPYALTAALAAEAAGAQGAFWPMHDLLFARQDRLDDASLRAYAEELGLDGDRVVGEAAQPFADKVESGLRGRPGRRGRRARRRSSSTGGSSTAGWSSAALRRAPSRTVRRGRRAGPRAGAAATVAPRPPASTARSARRGPAAGRPRRPLRFTDPARMPIVACSCSRSSSNARSVMNSEIVKPIPASVAPASRCDQRTPPGQDAPAGAQRQRGARRDADGRSRRPGPPRPRG